MTSIAAILVGMRVDRRPRLDISRPALPHRRFRRRPSLRRAILCSRRGTNAVAPVRLHRIRNDQLYHRYLGDPVEVLMLHEDGTSERVVVGPDLHAGQCVQLLIPGNTFHTVRRRDHKIKCRARWPAIKERCWETAGRNSLVTDECDAHKSARSVRLELQQCPNLLGR